MNIKTIKIKKLLNSESATTSEKAKIVFDEIKIALKEYDIVKLNFSETFVVSNFASTLIWEILKEYRKTNKIVWLGLTPSQKSLFKTVTEVTEEKLGLNNDTQYPKTKVEIINNLNGNISNSIKVFTNKEAIEIYQYVKRHTNLRISSPDFESCSILAKNKTNTGKLGYGYISIKKRDGFVSVEPFYMESDKLELNSLTWQEIKNNSLA